MKPWYQSRTLWLNVIVALFAALEANTGLLKPFLPDNFYALLAIALPVINVVLRTVTTQGLTLSNNA
jgi:hypothetical protein